MKKIARILYILVGVMVPIFIGSLHTAVHFIDLIHPDIQNYLQKEFIISGEMQPIWNAWGVISFMMGTSFIFIGFLNLIILKNTPKNEGPPILGIITMILYQLCVIYVGYEFSAPMQFYGGIFGEVIMLICLFLTLKNKTS